MKSFASSGDAGDIIYSLPVVRYHGPGIFYLRGEKFTRVHSTPKRIPLFERLLEAQPYIHDFRFNYGEDVTFSLDQFRTRFRNHYCETITQMHCREFNVPESELMKPWIDVDKRYGADVIINLTERYRTREFPWGDVYEKYKNAAAFIGTVSEHQQFETHYGKIDRLPTDDLYDIAAFIKGSKLFIGNQSCPLAIAHAMHHPTVCEMSRASCNGMERSINCHYSFGKTIYLPNL